MKNVLYIYIYLVDPGHSDIKPLTGMSRVRTEKNIAAVAASGNEDRDLFIRRRSQQLGLEWVC